MYRYSCNCFLVVNKISQPDIMILSGALAATLAFLPVTFGASCGSSGSQNGAQLDGVGSANNWYGICDQVVDLQASSCSVIWNYKSGNFWGYIKASTNTAFDYSDCRAAVANIAQQCPEAQSGWWGENGQFYQIAASNIPNDPGPALNC